MKPLPASFATWLTVSTPEEILALIELAKRGDRHEKALRFERASRSAQGTPRDERA